MKITALFFFALAICLISLANCGKARAQAPTPVANLRLDAGSGATAADSSGHGNDGSLQGGASWGPGLSGGHALVLSGRPGSFVDIPKTVVDTTKSYTVTACVKLARAVGWQTFASVDGDQVSGFFFQLRGDTGEFALTTLSRDNPDSETTFAGSSIDPLPDIWYHLAGVYDSSAQTLTLYVNGVLQQTTPFTTPWRAGGHTLIGRCLYAARPDDFANAAIANVRFYDTALSKSDIQAIADADLPASARESAPLPGQAANMQIDASHSGPALSPMQHGIMTEEINHSYDGGLYGELIRNRVFKDNSGGPVHWSLVQDSGGGGSMDLDSSQPLSDALPVSLKITNSSTSGSSRVGAANEGYWGIPVKPNTTYRVSFYAKAAPGFTGPLTVDVESSDGATVYARSQVSGMTGSWKQYVTKLKTGKVAVTSDARFVVSTNQPGTIWLDLVSLFPPTYDNTSNGNRPDIMQLLAGQKPAFLRFPGGNYLEGDTIDNRFDWKKTLGPLVNRPGHETPWTYRSSDGLGLLEYLEWCDDLHMQPLLAVYAGYSLNHYRNPNPERVAAGPALQPFVQEALDEIEFVTGGPDSKWGAERARLGHPKPFKLDYVEVGNEDGFDAERTYDARFTQFYDAIKAKYPNIKIIATTRVRSRTPDVIDEHYYLSSRAFERDIHHYDDYSRSGPKVFVGEWASQDGDPTANLASALGDAAWMTGMERNSDVVILETYAPLLVNINPDASQWPHPNLIGYNALSSYASPSYYAQQMFVTHRGDVNLPATINGAPRVAESVTKDTKTGAIYIHMVNWSTAAQPIHLTLSGVAHVAPIGTAITLTSASLQDVNSIDSPAKIVPVTKPASGLGSDFTYTFLPRSVTVLQLMTK
ncbi:MAG TPA: alpha-L-arabinofuranosidase C-terminal domain-containing protein [Capsulimonadaceae bacterium]|nr:alpha-L-arabinofuranosidase C-terminal domain-containing protein [Capsulimonadaceae bacterium]